ncbi:hypothetical protein C8J57DRAFT_8321 [Mycena rebaudengoi]|nr:hypothetical protein C8J57DRAFT_8321 [Mycena rebaudengoi]
MGWRCLGVAGIVLLVVSGPEAAADVVEQKGKDGVTDRVTNLDDGHRLKRAQCSPIEIIHSRVSVVPWTVRRTQDFWRDFCAEYASGRHFRYPSGGQTRNKVFGHPILLDVDAAPSQHTLPLPSCLIGL